MFWKPNVLKKVYVLEKFVLKNFVLKCLYF